MNGFDWFLYIFQWLNILSILVCLVFLLFTTRKYTGVIGTALTYLAVGIILNAFIQVVDLLSRTIDFISFQRIGGFTYQDAVRSGFATFGFIMLAIGFYKLSKIYKRF